MQLCKILKTDTRSRGFYSKKFTKPDVSNCFSIIIQVLGIKSIRQNFEPKNVQNGKPPF